LLGTIPKLNCARPTVIPVSRSFCWLKYNEQSPNPPGLLFQTGLEQSLVSQQSPLKLSIVFSFSFSEKQKNLFLVGVIAIIILLSGLFTLRFESPDPVLDSEKTEFAEILTEKLDGKILDTGDTLQGLVNVKLANPPGVFKNAIVNQDINLFHDSGQKLVAINIYATTMDDFIKTSKEYDLKYVSFKQSLGDFEPWYPYLADVYENEEKFPYLIKVFDTEQEEFEKLKAKVFEIDYKIYYEING